MRQGFVFDRLGVASAPWPGRAAELPSVPVGLGELGTVPERGPYLRDCGDAVVREEPEEALLNLSASSGSSCLASMIAACCFTSGSGRAASRISRRPAIPCCSSAADRSISFTSASATGITYLPIAWRRCGLVSTRAAPAATMPPMAHGEMPVLRPRNATSSAPPRNGSVARLSAIRWPVAPYREAQWVRLGESLAEDEELHAVRYLHRLMRQLSEEGAGNPDALEPLERVQAQITRTIEQLTAVRDAIAEAQPDREA